MFDMAAQMLSRSGSVRTEEEVRNILWRMFQQRQRESGAEFVRRGETYYVFTCGMAEAMSHDLVAWLVGLHEYEPTWSSWNSHEDCVEAEAGAILRMAAEAAISLMWEKGQAEGWREI